MPALHQIGSIETLLSNSPLSTSKLWWRDINTIAGPELHAFVARMGYEGYGHEAWSNVAVAQGEVRRAACRGEVGPVPMLEFRLPGVRMTTGEFRSLLAQVSVPRRKAILFALETGTDLKDVLSLRWPAALKINVTEQARWVLLGMPRHIRSDLVFWEYSRNGSPFPLVGLAEQLAGMTQNMTWSGLVDCYRRAIPYDYDAELRAFNDVRIQII